ncbi:HAMP domain-containing histidine kinase [Macrococcus equipercicus]|uniref:Signal transduction histidine-protein kinase ArlS n=1 Tax=Macrococcus equipercicus TaxID=69967 RepID=A0ABQ6RA88_9STAP|nr:ATP-binding protein [Macrococcus equipercicus]KAA1040236.1 HAMP domain-containing histidine kinase [Macrococcus equipercicus]
MNNSTSLKTKWTLITTSITFIIFMLFSFFIIYFISIYLKEQEYDSARRSTVDIGKLLVSENPGEVSTVDIRAAITDHQKVIFYDTAGQPYSSVSSDQTIRWTPRFERITRVEITEETYSNEAYIVVRAPINTMQSAGFLTIVHPLKIYHSIIQYMFVLAGIFGLTALFITAIISYFFSNHITKPIRKLSEQMKQIQRDGFQNKLTLPKSYYETDDMINTFNNMMAQLETSFNQQKQFVEDASHELRTPLQIIQGHLNLINRWGKNKPEVLDESLKISLDEMNRITNLVEELLLLTKDDKGQYNREVDTIAINDEIQARLKSLAQLHPDYRFEFHSSHKAIKLQMNRHQFEQLLLIFIDNAMKYDKDEQHIIIRTSLKNKVVQLEIIDHGAGIPKEDIPFIFDRFYRVDKSRSREMGGNGLGLSIARKIIESYGGTVKIDSELNKYTKVMIQFSEL